MRPTKTPPSDLDAVRVEYNDLAYIYTISTPDGVKIAVPYDKMIGLPKLFTIGPSATADIPTSMGYAVWTVKNLTSCSTSIRNPEKKVKAALKKKKKAKCVEVKWTVDHSNWFSYMHRRLDGSPWKKGAELYDVRDMILSSTREDVRRVLTLYTEKVGGKGFVFVSGDFLRDSVLGRPSDKIDVCVITASVDEVKGKLEVLYHSKAYKEQLKDFPRIDVTVLTRLALADMRVALTASDFGLGQIGAFQPFMWLNAGHATLFVATEQFIEDVAFKTCTTSGVKPAAEYENLFNKHIAPKYPDFTLVK